MEPHPPVSDPAHLNERLTRIEEHAGFAEHTVEQLSAEIAEMNRRMHTVLVRVEALEDRLRRLLEPPADSPGADQST